ncbi:hypothetical protein V502_02358 [Pseudogymnoascus sp. VKM F-4520 (FW-2644)]|nr:hypothetical protein V502_02358 [Pseudogymnoascus sp. VKM F-4520 (FW-2644)]
MAPGLSTKLLLAGLLSTASLVTAREPYDQEKQNTDATCANGCFAKFFTNFCSDDAGCVCNQQEHREGYLCCMAKECAPNVFPEGLTRSSLACETRNLPFTFEVEKACGFKLTTTYEAPMPTDTGEAASDCDNNCFSDSFPGGSCTDDAACMCTQKKYRERYFCCMAQGKNCPRTVFPDALKRHSNNCQERNLPFTFDVEEVCGVTFTTSTTAPAATSTPAPTSTSDSSKASSASETTAKGTTPDTTEASTPDSTTGASTPDSTDEASSSGTGTGTAEASATETVTPIPNSAPQAAVVFNGVAIVIAASAMLFL